MALLVLYQSTGYFLGEEHGILLLASVPYPAIRWVFRTSPRLPVNLLVKCRPIYAYDYVAI